MTKIGDEARKLLLNIPDTVKNDTPDPVDRTVGKLLLDGVELQYGELKLFVQGHVVREAREGVVQMAPDERRDLMASVTNSIQRSYPKVLRGDANRRTYNNLYSDLVLLEVLKEVKL